MERLVRIMTIVVVGAAVGVGAFFAGRVTAPTTNAPPSSTTVPHNTTTTTSVPSTSTTAPPPTTAAVQKCLTAQLHIEQAGFSGAMGTIERTFSLYNTSSTPCTIYGYPGLLLLGPGGTAETTTVIRGGGLSFEAVPPSTVMLAPGHTAYVNVGYSDVTTADSVCSTATALQVIAPTDTAHVSVALSPHVQACANGTLHESAVFGSTDGAATKTTAPSGQ